MGPEEKERGDLIVPEGLEKFEVGTLDDREAKGGFIAPEGHAEGVADQAPEDAEGEAEVEPAADQRAFGRSSSRR